MDNSAIGIPKKENAKTLSPLISKIKIEQSIQVKNIYLPIGGWTDALSFNYYGYEGLTISGKGAINKVHSTHDTPDIIDLHILFVSFIVGIELAIELAKLN